MKPPLPHINRGGKKNPDKDVPRLRVDLKRTGLAVITIVILSVLLSIHMLPSKVTLKPGDISPEEIIAQRTERYEDVAETEARRAKAAASVGKAYDIIPNASDQAIDSLKSIFVAIKFIHNSYPDAAVEKKLSHIRHELGSPLGPRLSDSTLLSLLGMDENGLREVEDDSLRIVSAVMSREIDGDFTSMRKIHKEVMEEAERLLGGSPRSILVGEIAQNTVRPNRIEDVNRTIDMRKAAEDKIVPVYIQIMRGDTVISKGDLVTQEHIQKFEALGLRNPKIDLPSVISLTVFVTIAVLLVVALLARYHPDVYASTRALALLVVIVVVSTLALKIGGSMLGIKLNTVQVGYFGVLWVVTAGMLVAILLNPHVSVVVTALLSMVLSLMLNNELRYTSSTFISSLVGIYSVANIRDRADLLRSVGMLAGVGILLVWVMGGINNDPLSEMLVGSIWAIMIALAAVSLFFFVITLLERPFGRTTHISLLELADTNKKLLRRLLMEAPGTYTHSMMVGHLAETAAEAIGADSLVARVASYYHDIGKIRRPHFFVENQNVENIHDHMNPTLSALVITSHIKDGVDIAREFRLPEVVVDVITQHHGTSLVQYFYNQAAGEHDPCTALESQFRYGGPKPRTKEAAIVMLADSVEAASRCIVKPTPAKIELLVNRIISDKLRDGQLDESDLTFKEVSCISEAFIRALTGTLHARIDYSEAEGKRLAANGDSDPKLTKDSSDTETDSGESTTSVTGGEL